MSTVPPLFPGQRISGEGDLLYGALHPFPLPGWGSPEVIRVGGQNWQVIFSLDKAGYIIPERGGTITKRDLDGPSVFIAGKRGNIDAADAAKNQKPITNNQQPTIVSPVRKKDRPGRSAGPSQYPIPRGFLEFRILLS